MYKIRINCTTQNDLTFNNQKIDKKTYDDIIIKLQPYDIEYIHSVIILYKKKRLIYN